jgi:peptidoglycan/LPS O-acetylase OafA/YrhL
MASVPATGGSPRPRHFPCFDGLRAVAAMLVVLVHTSFASGFTTRSPEGIYTARLEIGVSVFFLISGFLLYRPFAASHVGAGLRPGIGRFWVRRLLRIVPAYWLAFAVTTYWMHVNTVRPGWRSLLIYLGFAQIYFPSHAVSGITQAWSLCTEVSFYLFLPLFAAAIVARRRSDRHQLRRELVALGVLFAAGLGVRFWLLHQHRPLASVALDWLPAYLDLFALGMLLAVLSSWLAHRRAEPRWLWHPVMPWVSWAAAAGALWWVSHLGISRLPLQHNPPGRGMAQELLYGLFALLVLAPAVFGPQDRGLIRRALASPPVAALGVVSYGVYLWHQAWVTMFLRWYHDFLRAPPGTMFAVVAGLAIASASASYLVVERPLLGLKYRLGWAKQRRPERPVARRAEMSVRG